jgi:hypothetical protein
MSPISGNSGNFLPPLLCSSLTWIPRNGKNISIWEGSILGKEVLSIDENSIPLRSCMDNENLKILHDNLDWAKKIWKMDRLEHWEPTKASASPNFDPHSSS